MFHLNWNRWSSEYLFQLFLFLKNLKRIMILTVLILIIDLFCEKILTVYVVFFSSIFQDRAVVANLKYFRDKTVTDVLLPLKEMKKRRIWDGTVFERIC